MNLGAKGTIRPLRAAVARRRSGPGPRPGLRPRHVTPERLWREAAAGAGPGAGPGRAEAAGDSGAGAESGAGPPSATTSESEDESEHSSEAEEAEENEAEEERTSAAGSEKEEADEEEEEYDEEEEEEEDDNRAAKKPRHGGFILDEADVDDKYEGEDILEEALGAGPRAHPWVSPALPGSGSRAPPGALVAAEHVTPLEAPATSKWEQLLIVSSAQPAAARARGRGDRADLPHLPGRRT
ncbi:uncharacterized protein LOC141974155 isoform X2 [Athene noctua]|uniref:uncharacterized protein LOC141974155 isoform X2 n=1 Tax=Athene noctua TaxID=126797 RepID=UPI003EB9989B